MVEEDGSAWAKGRFEGVEVWEGEVFGKKREERIGVSTVENGAKFGGSFFGLAEIRTSWRLVGDFSTVDAHEVSSHVPECRDVFGRREWGWRRRLDARA